MAVVDLLGLLARFADVDDLEVQRAYYRTKVPSVGPQAYLNIVFRPTDVAVRKEVEHEVGLQPDLVEFYSRCNGARLFFDRVSIYGCLPRPHPPLDRDDPFGFLPFDLRRVNAELGEDLAERNLLCVGAYGYDRSYVSVRRDTCEVVCATGDDFDRLRARWRSLSDWLSSEIPRVGGCFDERGKLLVTPEATLPGLTH